jgi:hypothetical protein
MAEPTWQPTMQPKNFSRKATVPPGAGSALAAAGKRTLLLMK